MNRDVELQVLSDYYQAQYNFMSSILTSGFITLLALVLTLYYQGIFNIASFILLLGVLCILFGYLGIKTVNRIYDGYLFIIDDLLIQVKKGELLPL